MDHNDYDSRRKSHKANNGLLIKLYMTITVRTNRTPLFSLADMPVIITINNIRGVGRNFSREGCLNVTFQKCSLCNDLFTNTLYRNCIKYAPQKGGGVIQPPRPSPSYAAEHPTCHSIACIKINTLAFTTTILIYILNFTNHNHQTFHLSQRYQGINHTDKQVLTNLWQR